MGLHGHAWTTWFYLIGLNLLFLGNLNGSCPFLLDQRIWQNHTTPLFYIIRRVFPRPSQRATSMRVRHEAKTMRLPSASRPGAEQKRVLQKKRRRDAAGPHVEGGVLGFGQKVGHKSCGAPPSNSCGGIWIWNNSQD